MRLLVIPARADPTLETAAPGWTVLDLERAHAERVLDPGRLAAEAAAADVPGRRRLLLAAAAQLLGAPGAQTRLRAAGAAYAGTCDEGSGLVLRLDDLELVCGTTERLDDVLALDAGRSPFAPEIDAAVAAARGAERVVVCLERDQQLPAVAALVARLAAAGGRPEVAGGFAAAHWAALSSRPPLSAARLVEAPRRERRLAGLPGLGCEAPLAWRDGPDEPVPGGEWAGRVSLRELAEGTIDLDRCRFAVAGFCAAHEEVVAPDGWRAAREAVRRASCRLVGEWWVGAPGIGRDELERTLAAEEREPLFDWVAGLRRFHWPAGRRDGAWAGRRVSLLAAPDGLDLAHFQRFACPGTIPDGELDAVLGDLWRRLDARAPVVAGRVAAAFASPQPAAAPGPRVELDPDCAVVELPGEDGRGRWTAVNLRTGVALAVDARLAPHVAALRRPAAADAALGRLPAPARERALGVLRARAVIRSCA